MSEEKNVLNEVEKSGYNASDLPFDFMEGTETALICESDENTGNTFAEVLKDMGYQTSKASSAREALKAMRFHLFDVIVINENFDSPGGSKNDVLVYLEALSMSTRRQIFVVLASNTYRTMDNMAAFNKSVNFVFSLKNMDEAGTILRKAVADNVAFYRVMKETMRKFGKI